MLICNFDPYQFAFCDNTRKESTTATVHDPLPLELPDLWNKCKDGLPTKDGNYLVFYKMGVQNVVCFGKGDELKTDVSRWYYEDVGYVTYPEDITHWTELPNNPID